MGLETQKTSKACDNWTEIFFGQKIETPKFKKIFRSCLRSNLQRGIIDTQLHLTTNGQFTSGLLGKNKTKQNSNLTI